MSEARTSASIKEFYGVKLAAYGGGYSEGFCCCCTRRMASDKQLHAEEAAPYVRVAASLGLEDSTLTSRIHRSRRSGHHHPRPPRGTLTCLGSGEGHAHLSTRRAARSIECSAVTSTWGKLGSCRSVEVGDTLCHLLDQ